MLQGLLALVLDLHAIREPYCPIDDVKRNLSLIEHEVTFTFIKKLGGETNGRQDLVSWGVPCSAFPTRVTNWLNHVKPNVIQASCLQDRSHLRFLSMPPT